MSIIVLLCFNIYFYWAYKIPPLSERGNLFQSLLCQQENGIQKKKSIDGGGVNINQKKGDAENSWADRAPEINERGDIWLIKSGISCRISHIRG